MITISSTTDRVFLVFEDDLKWVISIKGEIFEISLCDQKVLLSLLPFLELGRNKIFKQLNYRNAQELFPELIVIEAGLKNGSEHWICCALDWLQETQSIKKIQLLDKYLKKIPINKTKYSQSLRHQARSLLAMIKP